VSASILSAKPSQCNLNKNELKALNSLKKDENIKILPADKGRCTVVLNTKDYDRKAKALLDDASTYKPLKKDPTSGIKRKIVSKLSEFEKEGVIDTKLKYQLYPTAENIPTFYGLPKVHKDSVPLRPIVSSIGSVTYNIAKHLAKILGPLVGQSEHHILNSKDFAEKIKGLVLDPDDTITSFDVTALFTSIPPVEAVSAVRELLTQDSNLHERTDLSPDQICDLLELCLDNTYFSYGGNFYQQCHGCSMGSPVSPIISNLYMERFEREALSTFNGTPPSKWYRYVDDTWVLIKSGELDRFFEHINQIDPCIKFTQEGLVDNKLAFLDCLVQVEQDLSLSVSVYRKQTHTDQYLQFDSNHPLIQKLGVVKTLFHRADTIISKESDKNSEHNHLRQALHHCGYKDWAINKALNLGGNNNDKPAGKKSNNPGKSVSVTIPYHGDLSEKLRRIYRDHGISTHFKPTNTIRQSLVHPKDKQPKGRLSGVVYGVRCAEDQDCQEHYIGETGQPLKNRMSQHRRASSSGNDSAVYTHLKASGHQFELEDVVILDREQRWYERGVKEAIWVRAEQPSLNRSGGVRTNLSHGWDRTIKTIPRRLTSAGSDRKSYSIPSQPC